MQIIRALFKRKATYLAEPEWLSVPWQALPKDNFHSLLDLLARVTCLIEQSDQILASSSSTARLTRIAVFLTNGSRLEQELKCWYNNFLLGLPKLPYTELPVEDVVQDEVFQTMLHFETFELFQMHSIYWAALCLLYDCLHEVRHHLYGPTYRLCSSLQAHGVGNPTNEMRDEFYTPSEAPDPHRGIFQYQELVYYHKSATCATLIAKSIYSLLLQYTQHLGIHCVLFPLRIALHVFSKQPGPEASWCSQKFEEFHRRGYLFAKVLRDTSWDDFPSLLS